MIEIADSYLIPWITSSESLPSESDVIIEEFLLNEKQEKNVSTIDFRPGFGFD